MKVVVYCLFDLMRVNYKASLFDLPPNSMGGHFEDM